MENYLGEIRLFACNFAPRYWATCNGALLSIQQNQALYSLIGTYYGGNGTTTFALPDLRGRVPMGLGPTYPIGSSGGSETVTLTMAQMAVHSHNFMVYNGFGNQPEPNDILAIPHNANAQDVTINIYNTSATSMTTLNQDSVTITGGSQPHNNLQPYTTLNFCIALAGIFPTRP